MHLIQDVRPIKTRHGKKLRRTSGKAKRHHIVVSG